MKKLFPFFLIFWTPLIFAYEGPIFDDGEGRGYVSCKDGCDCRIGDEEEEDETTYSATYSEWRRYKTSFGKETVIAHFPQEPAISQSSTLLTAYAYDHAVLYSLAGYFPPMANIDHEVWFEEIVANASIHPFRLINHKVYQTPSGEWVMDYIVHDFVQNLIIKSRAKATSKNGYILQSVKPNGTSDYFEYFLNHCWIKAN